MPIHGGKFRIFMIAQHLRKLAVRRQTLSIVAIIIGQKVTLAILLFLFPLLFPMLFGDGATDGRFQAWDTKAYLEIAAHGYGMGDANCAFYPLWPVCIRCGSIITGWHPLLAAYVMGNLFSLAGLLIFHRLVLERHGLSNANQSTILLLLFPGSMFFFVPYSESLFFLLLMACWLCLHRERYLWVAFFAFFLPLTRATGCFIIPVLAWELFRKQVQWRTYAVCLAPIIGYVIYFAIMYFYTGRAFAGFDAQQEYPAKPSIGKIFDAPGFLHALLNGLWRHDFLNSFLDRIIFFAFLISLFWVLKLNVGYYFYAMGAGLVPAVSNSLMSYTRFFILVFPVFIVWGAAKRTRWLVPFLYMLFFSLQVLLFLLHFSKHWAG